MEQQQKEPSEDPIHFSKIISNKSDFKRLSTATCKSKYPIVFIFFVWIFLCLIIINASLYKDTYGVDYKEAKWRRTIYLIFGAICYVIYLIGSFCSDPHKYYYEKDNKIITEKIGDIYKSNPSIILCAECYHYELKPTGRDNYSEMKVVSHSEEVEFKYNFCRDIRGNLYLNITENKPYVLLKVIQEIIFEDDFTYNEFINLENDLIEKK